MLAERITSCIRAGGGADGDDFRGYRVIWRRPITAEFLGHRFVSNPPPSTGVLILALLLLDRAGLGGPHGSADEIARLVGVMGEQALARGPGFAQLHGGGLARRLYDEDRVSEAAARLLEERPPIVPEPVEPSRTTQISSSMRRAMPPR